MLAEEEIQTEDAVVFQRSEDETVEEDRSALLPHYGCSPFMGIDVRDRMVLPSNQTVIQRCALVEFVNIPYRLVAGSDENSAPGVNVEGNRATGLTGVGGNANYARRTKSARACAEEMAFAYRHNNPWGFQVFEVLTGRSDAFEVFRSVLPRRMNGREMYEHLTGLGELTGPRENIRQQLLTACVEFGEFKDETLTASQQEVSDRKAGGKGKARYDKRDEMVARAWGEPLPEINPTPIVQMPAQSPVDLSPLAEIFKTQAEENRRRDKENQARIEELATQVASLKKTARKGQSEQA